MNNNRDVIIYSLSIGILVFLSLVLAFLTLPIIGDFLVALISFLMFLSLLWIWYITTVDLRDRLATLNIYKNLSIVKILLIKRQKRSYLNILINLLSLIAYLSYSYVNGKSDYIVVSFFVLVSALYLVNENFFQYRVKKGYYGNNEREAREIIEFILSNCTHIDFTDGGKRKKIIDEEELEKIIDKEWLHEGLQA